MNNRQILQDLLKVERPLVMPDAYDGLSARLIQIAGFKAVQCSGFSMGLASLAAPEQAVDLNRNLDATRNMVKAVTIPVMADGEDGLALQRPYTRPSVRSWMSVCQGSTLRIRFCHPPRTRA
jgi:2-methylisocitrate lyase-like PEP mutase family enzyme